MSSNTLKVILTPLMFWVLWFVTTLIVGPLTPAFGVWKHFMFGILTTMTGFLFTWIFLQRENATFADAGLALGRGSLIRFGVGLLIGCGIFGIVLVALLVFTPLQLEFNSSQTLATFSFSAFVTFIPLAFMEELVYRGYPFRSLERSFGLWTAQVAGAIVFALAHVASGQSVSGAFLGPGVYAFVFGLAAVWSGGIAMPFGIHLALNLSQLVMGMKGSPASIWLLSEEEGTTAISSPETVGLSAQLAVLAVSLALTQYYVRNAGREGS